MRYMVEGCGKEGIWSMEYTAGHDGGDESVTFETWEEARAFIRLRVTEDGWNPKRLRIVEVEMEGEGNDN